MATFPQIASPPEALAEVIVNEALETLEHQAVYGKRHETTTGLTWGYYGGRWGGFVVAAGTLALTLSDTNYIVVEIATGAISASTAATNWNNGTDYVRVYKVTTSASAVTAVEDHRSGPGGVHGGAGGAPGASGAATTQTEEMLTGYIGTVVDKDYRIVVKARHGGTITELTTRSESGTCTLTGKINTTALGGTANSVSSTESSQAHATANVFAAGDDIVLTASANSACLGLSFNIGYTRVLQA